MTFLNRAPAGQRLELMAIVGPWLVRLATLGLIVAILTLLGLIHSRSQTARQLVDIEAPGLLSGSGPTSLPVMPDMGDPQSPPGAVLRIYLDPAVNMAYEDIFQEAAARYGLDWRLLAELAYQESRMNPLAIGRDRDLGLMQIIPSTWQEWAPQVGVTDPFDPYSNVLVSAAYLAYLRDYCRLHGYAELPWMLVGYNWGPDNLRRLFENDGDWAQVPARQRRYSLEILQAASNKTDRWQTQQVK